MSVDLYLFSSNFARLAEELKQSKISVVKNTDPSLKQLSELPDFDKRLDLAKTLWSKLGEGSARAVFQLNEKLVIKVAINDKGLAQNKLEAQPRLHTECTCPVVAADPNGKWIVFKSNNSITEKEFKELTGMSFTSYCSALWYKFDNNSDDNPPKDYDEIEQNPFFQCVLQLILANDLLIGDLGRGKISSYGELDGKVVIRDYGMDREEWKEHYDDSSSSSSSGSSSSTKTSS